MSPGTVTSSDELFHRLPAEKGHAALPPARPQNPRTAEYTIAIIPKMPSNTHARETRARANISHQGVCNVKFQVNFKYQGAANSARSGALILDAENKEAAKKAASKQLSDQYDWHKLTSITDLGQSNLDLKSK